MVLLAANLDGISPAVAVLAGLVPFVSPCVLPLVPAYLAYLGARAGQPAIATAAGARRRHHLGGTNSNPPSLCKCAFKSPAVSLPVCIRDPKDLAVREPTAPICWPTSRQVVVGGTGHYLNCLSELTGVLKLLTGHGRGLEPRPPTLRSAEDYDRCR